jgi:hypothetical protein
MKLTLDQKLFGWNVDQWAVAIGEYGMCNSDIDTALDVQERWRIVHEDDPEVAESYPLILPDPLTAIEMMQSTPQTSPPVVRRPRTPRGKGSPHGATVNGKFKTPTEIADMAMAEIKDEMGFTAIRSVEFLTDVRGIENPVDGQMIHVTQDGSQHVYNMHLRMWHKVQEVLDDGYPEADFETIKPVEEELTLKIPADMMELEPLDAAVCAEAEVQVEAECESGDESWQSNARLLPSAFREKNQG